MPRSWRSQIADEVRACSMMKPKCRFEECECTKVQQDESCPVGYPFLLCEKCDGKGFVEIKL